MMNVGLDGSKFAKDFASSCIIDMLCQAAIEQEKKVADIRLRVGSVSPTDEALLSMMWNDLAPLTRGEA
jgi:hypothetical protein